ncbi:MAG TPA: hypothetical protein VGB24_02650 [Longimicrobium sp.]|jgi:hypothetical protein|uniref:hypothetical protein n=1 Tax=Longimicrobium sp. TaxID=2029185 RepID=UPI002EDA1FFA
MSEEKLRWEIEKMKLEIEQLRRRFYEQPSFWVSILSFVIALGGVVGQNALSSIRKERAELDREKAAHVRDSINVEVQSLNLRRDSLSRRNESLRAEVIALEAVRANLSQQVESVHQATRLLPLPAKVQEQIKSAGRASYTVAGYCYSVAQAQCQSMQQAIRDRGYTVVRGGPLSRRPSWLAPRSTVLYYDANAAADAQQLAGVLQQQTGVRFEVSQGGGLGVSSGQQRYSLRVHFVGSS